MKAIKRCKVPGGVLCATFFLLSYCSGDEKTKAPGGGAETAPVSVRSDLHRALAKLSAPNRNANRDDEDGQDEPADGPTQSDDDGDYESGQNGPPAGPTRDGDDGDDEDPDDGDETPDDGSQKEMTDDEEGYPADDGYPADADDRVPPRRTPTRIPESDDDDEEMPDDGATPADGDEVPADGGEAPDDGDETPRAGRTSNPRYPSTDHEEDYVDHDDYVMDYQDEDGAEEENDPNDPDPDDQPEGWKAIPIDELPAYMGAKVPQEMLRPTKEYLLANTTTVQNLTGQKLVVFIQGSGDQLDVLGTLDLKSEFNMVGLVGKKLALATLAGENVGNSTSVVLTSGIMQFTAAGAARLNGPSRQSTRSEKKPIKAAIFQLTKSEKKQIKSVKFQLNKSEKKQIKAAKFALKFTANPALRAVLQAKIAFLKARGQLRQLKNDMLFVLGFVPGGNLPFAGIVPAPIPPSFFSPFQNLLAQFLGAPLGGGNGFSGGGNFPGGGAGQGGKAVINGPFGGKIVIGGGNVPGSGKIPVGGGFAGGGISGVGGQAGAGGNPGFKLKPLRTQWAGGNALTSRMSKTVIHTQAQWNAAWKDAHPITKSKNVPKPPVVDFNKHMVLAVFMGDGWKGHPVSITSVKRSGNNLRATVRETVPPAGVTASKLKSPYCFQQVTASKLPVSFVIKK